MFTHLFKQNVYLLRLTVFVFIYALLTYLTIRYFAINGHVSMVWLPSGLALSAVLLWGERYLLGIFFGALLTNGVTGAGFAAIGIGLANTLEIFVASRLLTRVFRFNIDNFLLSDYLRLAAAVALSACVGALVGVLSLYLLHSPAEAFLATRLLAWWQGDMLGMLLVTPFLLIWRSRPQADMSRSYLFEAMGCLICNVVASQAVFFNWLQLSYIADVYLSVPFILWAAVRFGRHGVSLLIVVNLLHGMLALKYYYADFALLDKQTGLLDFWYYLLVLAIPAMLLALIIEQLAADKLAIANSERRFKLLVEGLPFAVCEISAKGELTSCNKAGWALFADSRKEKNTRPNYFHFIDKASTTKLSLKLNQALAGQAQQLEFSVASGRIYQAGFIPLANSAESEVSLLSFTRDITDEANARASLEVEAMVYQYSNEAMMVTDSRHQIIAVNSAFTALTGFSAEEACGKSEQFFFVNKDSLSEQALQDSLQQHGSWQGELKGTCKDNSERTFAFNINAIYNCDHQCSRYILQFNDITESQRDRALMWQQANFDRLTQLPNRNMFIDRLEQEVKKDKRLAKPFALLFIDLDHFKAVNDGLGHCKGDKLLIEVATRIKNCLRESDTVARLGGDEFCVILSGVASKKMIDRMASQIIAALTAVFQLAESTAFVSASIGIARYPKDGQSSDELLAYADMAMYTAKKHGRDGFAYFSYQMKQRSDVQQQISEQLREAITKQQFAIYYQPIVDMHSQKVVKAEALIRWYHPTWGLVEPERFIHAALTSGQIVEIDHYIFRQATAQVKKWRDRWDPNFKISINQSPLQFSGCNGSECCLNYLKELDLPGNSVTIDVSEKVFIDTPSNVMQQLAAFRRAGVEIALDDFGRSSPSLVNPTNFNISYLKLDKANVGQLDSEHGDSLLCAAMIAVAHKLGLKVIAEGIETEEQFRQLLHSGCDYGQGYWFSRPLPAAEFEAVYARNRVTALG